MKNHLFKKVIKVAKYIAILLLSIDMIALAIPKLLHMQFRLDHYRTFVPLAELPKPELMMSFFGRSYAYNIFIGLTELAIGILIVFKRTRLIGLLISLGVSLNIFIINIEFDLGFGMISHVTMALLLTIILLIEYQSDLYKFFVKFGGKINGKTLKVNDGIWKKLRIIYVIIFPIAYFTFSYYVISSFDYKFIGSYEIKETRIADSLVKFKKGKITSEPMLFFEKNNRVVLSVNNSIHYGWYEIEDEHLQMNFQKSTNHELEYIDAQIKDYKFINGKINDSISILIEIYRLPKGKDYLNNLYMN